MIIYLNSYLFFLLLWTLVAESGGYVTLRDRSRRGERCNTFVLHHVHQLELMSMNLWQLQRPYLFLFFRYCTFTFWYHVSFNPDSSAAIMFPPTAMPPPSASMNPPSYTALRCPSSLMPPPSAARCLNLLLYLQFPSRERSNNPLQTGCSIHTFLIFMFAFSVSSDYAWLTIIILILYFTPRSIYIFLNL